MPEPRPSTYEIADKLEHGSRQDFAKALTDAFNNLSHDDFRTMLNQVKKYNDFDLKLNTKLPAMSITNGKFDIPEVDVSTPNKYVGNLWRTKEVAWTGNTIGNNATTLLGDAEAASNYAPSKDVKAIASSAALDQQAQVLEEQKNIPGATKLYDSALQAATGARSIDGLALSNVLALDAKAAFYGRQGNIDGAAKLYQQADDSATHANSTSASDGKGFASAYALDAHAEFLEKNGKSIDAAELYDQALDSAKSLKISSSAFPGTAYAIALAHAEIEKAGYLERSGSILDASKMYDGAIHDAGSGQTNGNAFAKFLSTDAKAGFLERQGDVTKANELYQTTVDQSLAQPDSETKTLVKTKALDSLAAFYERQGKPDLATRYYDEAYSDASQAVTHNVYGLAASSAAIAKYDFVERQNLGLKAPFSSSSDGAAEGFQMAISPWPFPENAATWFPLK